MTSDGRGGRRQRRFSAKENLSEIDRKALSDLLAKLAPGATATQREFALKIVVKGIDICRERAPSRRALSGLPQTSRRELAKLKKGKMGPVFNSFFHLGGKTYGAASDGLYEIHAPEPDNPPTAGYGKLDQAIVNSLRGLSFLHQVAAGASSPNLNLVFNPSTGEGAHDRTVADVLLEGLVNPGDHEAELAGFVYLAITKGLGLKASTYDLHQFDPQKVKTGANYCRLLVLALEQSGIDSPREKLRPLMLKGQDAAKELLAPAVEYADGRTFSAFEMEFPEVNA